MSDVEWHSVAPAPIVLIHGTESLIADRAVQRLRALAREADPSVEIHDLSGDALGPGALTQVTSPSLFGEPRLVLVPELQAAPDALVGELLDYLKAPEPDVTLVLVHRGGNRGKKLLDALKKAGVPRVDASPVKRAGDKQTFVAAEFARAQRRIQPEALVALVDAFGTDLAELAAISRQLIEDTTPDPGEQAAQVSVADVHALTAGRVESTAFAVADAAIAGREQEALQLLQQAQLAGADPVPIVAAVASKMRSLAKVSAPGATPRSLGMPDWMLRNLGREAHSWNDRSLARALEAVARADHEVKGAGRDPQWSVQRMVMGICRARRAR
ncbi:DNA polymerase III subunit delta [Brachybacterium saurashtrense]|uniref:DNA-directed DNA polymerase n=1 Tax=Brachybacterium saurashtrense TaxID=556288 RepID=A0A345YMT0_9MICO|nr:DNA polymerase III subunit delta [Brachybacterium saurashtrense]AXK45232.1 DNA polymerase III subunit delta [Brachybacterium saurashtrense]RRR22014.1 DNA polymerase III subunit delta [Brachybacterium saurashtrense]